ncbi:MAG TPA: phosphate ABC transporter substrate-binding protein PstS [Caulobacteraceae bacterium]|jgi:phosphate transport system substrate-binding protein
MFKKLVVAVAATLCAGVAAAAVAETLSGAGATFPQPIYVKWAEAYKASSGTAINYQGIGSGGGIKQIEANTVEFGASDKPLHGADLTANGLYQFPTVIGGIVPAVNIPGVASAQLKLTGPLLADIYLGNIKTWNDPRIARMNPGLRLPGIPITTVHRSDGSGTNFLFTSYLSGISPQFAHTVGASDSVQWPGGLGGKGNPGVAAFVKSTVGSIGYVEYFFAKGNHIPFALVQSRSGTYPQPVAASFAAAAAGANWAASDHNFVLLLNQPGANSWPITGATFILVHKEQKNPETCRAVLKFFDWAYKNGDAAAAQLDYVPLPLALKNQIRKQWTANVHAGGKPCYP